MADINIYPALAINGGGVGAMDDIDGHDLLDLDRCHVFNEFHPIYRMDADSGLAEEYPWVIAPDENADDKRWLCEEINGQHIIYSVDLTPVNLAVADFRKRYVTNHATGQKVFNLPDVDATHLGLALFWFHHINSVGNGTIKIVAKATDQIQDSGLGGFFQTTPRVGEISILNLVLVTETVWGFMDSPLGVWG